jgi:hypothetical protein
MKTPRNYDSLRTTAVSASEGRLKMDLGARRFGRRRTDTERKARHKRLYGTLDNFPKRRRYLRRKLASL